VQPVYFSDFIPTNTIFDPFHNGYLVTVTNAPTVLVIVAYVTSVITPKTMSVRRPDMSTLPVGSNTLDNNPTYTSTSTTTEPFTWDESGFWPPSLTFFTPGSSGMARVPLAVPRLVSATPAKLDLCHWPPFPSMTEYPVVK
jgi:hypothetical protein